MADLPAALTYGKVVGRLILAVADAGDAGRNPDAVAAVGTVAFTPKNANVKVTTAGAEATVVLQKITCTLDTDGYLLDPMGVAGVWLVTGVYTVTYALSDANIDSHDIEVLATHTDAAPLDLTTAMPAGTVLTPSQYAELSSRVDALEATPPGSVSDASTTVKGIVKLAGDLSGTAALPTVAKVNGVTITGTPTAGQVPTATSGTAAAWSTPSGSTPDATTSTKGVVQLAGDLAGTAAAPTVPGLAGKASNTITISAGTGLTGGGDLTANRTLTVAYGTTGTTAAAGNDSRIVNAVPNTRTITAGTGLTGGGDLTANRTLAVAYGTTSTTAAIGNDARFTDPQYDVNTVATSGTTQTLAATFASHKVTLSANCTFTFSAPTKVGHTFVLYLTGAFTPTFPASVKWDGGAAPTYTSPALYTFTTLDTGTTWIGSQVAKAIA